MQSTLNRNRWMLTTALCGAFILLVSGGHSVADDNNQGDGKTATPIKHVIILIGENRTFDSIYGMY